jgi:hypothetical protein
MATLVASATAACENFAVPLDVIVEPAAIGVWESSEPLGGGLVRFRLSDGTSFEIDETRDQLAIANGSEPGAGTLLASGDGPNGRWWIVSNLAVDDDLPEGSHLLFSAIAYDEPATVVFRAWSDRAKGFEHEFGIRLRKAVGSQLATPPPETDPAFGRLNRFCLDELGAVTSAQ